jgi:hypothetical protein
MKEADGTVFQPADYGRRYACLAGYMPSAAWAWMVCGHVDPKLIFYNDL